MIHVVVGTRRLQEILGYGLHRSLPFLTSLSRIDEMVGQTNLKV